MELQERRRTAVGLKHRRAIRMLQFLACWINLQASLRESSQSVSAVIPKPFCPLIFRESHRGPGRLSPGSGLVFGFQSEVEFDFVDRLKVVFRFVHSLLGSADQVGSGPGRLSPGSGLVFGFQSEVEFDFVDRLKVVFRFVHSLLGSADQVG